MATPHPAVSPLEVAAALRKTAEFCRDPDSPKNLQADLAADIGGNPCDPLAPRARTWCAVGYIRRELGRTFESVSHLAGVREAHIYEPFDAGQYEACARALESCAARLEASIPEIPEPATTEASVAVCV